MSTTAEQVYTGPKRLAVRGATVLAAILAAVAVHVVFVEIAGVDVKVPESFGSRDLVPLEFGAVVGAATIACLAGWAFLTVLEKITSKAWTIWLVAATLLYLLSMPYQPGFRAVDRIMLILTHTALAVVLVLGMRLTAKRP